MMSRLVRIFLTSLTVLFGQTALAASQSWNITEVDPDNGAQGQWLVNVESGNKLNGSTNMQFDTGAMLTYKLDGSISNGAISVNLIDRSDGRKDCVFSGNVSLNPDKVSHKILGEVKCADAKFYLRGGY
jgi:hypothetical protein